MKKQRMRALGIVTLTALLLTLCACEKHSHDFDDWVEVKAASCTEEGKRERECDCGETETRKIPKSSHEYSRKVTTEAGCSNDGVFTYTCEHCDDTYTESFPVKTYTSTEIYDLYQNTVGDVMIYDKQGRELAFGSCFVYKEDGTLITNYHVIEGAYSADVTFGEDTYDVEKVLAYDKTLDIAILKISASDLKPAVLCEKDHKVGEIVYTFGNSKGLSATFADGMITYSNREVEGVAYVQHDAPISGGNSGGPLINVYGEVIGINTWTVVDAQNLNFAIHLSELEHLDYGKAMTMQEVYEAENDPFTKVVDLIKSAGEYDDGVYELELDWDYSEDGESIYTWGAYHESGVDTVIFYITVDDICAAAVYVEPDLLGIYKWTFFSDTGDEMSGTLYGRSFDGNQDLSYSDTNIRDSERREMICTLATLMLDRLCSELDSSLYDIDVTAADLGFLQY